MQKRKFKRFGAVFLIVAMIVTMFSTVSASADAGGTAGGESSTTSAIYVNPGWYLRSPHRISYNDQDGKEHRGIAPALFSLKLLGASDSEAFGVYCCDLITDAKNGTTYVRTNLEDALNEDSATGSDYTAYYTKENAARLRYILKYGTADTANAKTANAKTGSRRYITTWWKAQKQAMRINPSSCSSPMKIPF